MKRIITLIAAAVLMTIATNSFAQISVGAGYLHAGDQITLKGMDPIETGMNGAYAGFSYNLPISGLIGITPGLYYSLLFSNDSALEGLLNAKVREHFVNVPVYLNLGFNLGENSRLFLFAGPTVQLGLISTIEASAGSISSGKVEGIHDLEPLMELVECQRVAHLFMNAMVKNTSTAVVRQLRRSRASVLFIVKVPECLSSQDW